MRLGRNSAPTYHHHQDVIIWSCKSLSNLQRVLGWLYVVPTLGSHFFLENWQRHSHFPPKLLFEGENYLMH